MRRQNSKCEALRSWIDCVDRNRTNAEAKGQTFRLSERGDLGRCELLRLEVHERITFQRGAKVQNAGIRLSKDDECSAEVLVREHALLVCDNERRIGRNDLPQ